MSRAAPFQPDLKFPTGSAVWPDGSISFEQAVAVCVSMTQIPLVPSLGITNVLASTLSELSPHAPSTIAVIGTLTDENSWCPMCAGASKPEGDSNPERIEFARSTVIPLRAAGAIQAGGTAAYAPAGSSTDRAKFLELIASTEGSFESSMSMAVVSSGAAGHVLAVLWDGEASSLTPLAMSYLRCVMFKAIGVVDAAFPLGITNTSMFTTRELRTMRLLLMGKTVPQIARHFDCSKYTVHDHAKNIYRKLGVHSRGEMFYRVGLLDTEMLI
ncbi:MAG: helix-turn-helix transcriptional regulator [Phycisphaera sp.]|nr:MAG: helix-turn-helix transcriptional regulator [Phycisphaera sp.]